MPKGTDKEILVDHLDKIPERVWQMYFAPGGAIPQLQESLKKVCGKIDKLNAKMDRYNGLMDKQKALEECYENQDKKFDELTKVIAEQVGFCKTVQGQKDLMAELNAQHKKDIADMTEKHDNNINDMVIQAREDEWRRFKRYASLSGILLTIAGLILRYAVFAN